ncbi:MAG: PIN domain-containing protein [Deltaproteobacteria bacterium]|nr:PIN domain-containing protein [Deltaproteobacteria bacterium]
MIIPDLNLLLYAYDSVSRNHEKAARWWAESLNGREPIGLPTVVLYGFIRLATSPKVFNSPMTVQTVGSIVLEWLERPHVVEVDGGRAHLRSSLDLLEAAGTAGNLVTDAQIAAIALHHGATVYTNDVDFSRFRRLRIRNPLRS